MSLPAMLRSFLESLREVGALNLDGGRFLRRFDGLDFVPRVIVLRWKVVALGGRPTAWGMKKLPSQRYRRIISGSTAPASTTSSHCL